MTYTKSEIRHWARREAAQHVRAPGQAVLAIRMLILGYIHGLGVACDHSRHKGDRKRLDGLINDAKGAMDDDQG